MTTSINHVRPWIFVGPFVMALAACPQKDPGTTDDPQDTTSDASSSTTAATPTSSGPTSTPTGETTATPESETTSSAEPETTSDSTSNSSSTTAPSEPETTSSSTTSTLDPDTTGGDDCPVDLTVTLAVNFDQCKGELVLIATVHNLGTVDVVPAGMDATFYQGADPSGIKLATKPTVEPLPAGSSTDVVFVVFAPGESTDYFVEVGFIDECNQDNNSDLITDVACPD
jgi:hypothetical protein